MKIQLSRLLAAQLLYHKYPEFVRCAFYLSMGVHQIAEYAADETQKGYLRRKSLINDARELGISDKDVIVVKE